MGVGGKADREVPGRDGWPRHWRIVEEQGIIGLVEFPLWRGASAEGFPPKLLDATDCIVDVNVTPVHLETAILARRRLGRSDHCVDVVTVNFVAAWFQLVQSALLQERERSREKRIHLEIVRSIVQMVQNHLG